MDASPYHVLAFYHLVSIEDPLAEVARHKAFFEGRDATGRIYISHEGINAQLSGAAREAQSYIDWLRSDLRYRDADVKWQGHHENVFPRMTIKVRKELVAMGVEADLTKRGEAITPRRWREMLESGEEITLLDIRNGYEWDLGHFEGSARPTCETFRDFPRLADEVSRKLDPKESKVMMCCTGGIRCEYFSALLKERGFEQVYQLEGGIIKYAQEEGGRHFKGKLFVFDDRLAVDVNEEERRPSGPCHFCAGASDHFFNCANMDCNALFLSCLACLEGQKGCCKAECGTGERLRPLAHQRIAKPFRRWYHYIKEKARARFDEERAKERGKSSQSLAVEESTPV